MIVSRLFKVPELTVIGLAVALVAGLLPPNVFAQPEEIEKPALTRYAIPKETWATPLKRGFQWVYQPELLDKTLPLFGYNLSKVYFDSGSVCASPDIHQYSEVDLKKVALVHQGKVYDGFSLGGQVDTDTLQILARKVATQKVLTTKGFNIGTEFKDATKTVANFSEGLAGSRSNDTGKGVVASAEQYFRDTWIPSGPAAKDLMSQMIAKAKVSTKEFQTTKDLSQYWIEKADNVSEEVTDHTYRSGKMLQYLANAIKNKDGKAGLTVSKVCASYRFIASHQDVLGTSLLLATKRPLPKVTSDIRLIGSPALPVITPR